MAPCMVPYYQNQSLADFEPKLPESTDQNSMSLYFKHGKVQEIWLYPTRD
jgi:hypothetical protein